MTAEAEPDLPGLKTRPPREDLTGTRSDHLRESRRHAMRNPESSAAGTRCVTRSLQTPGCVSIRSRASVVGFRTNAYDTLVSSAG
jgi:hypothetical protein